MGQFWLEYQEGGQVQRFDFDQKTVSIGRDSSSDFHLDHPTVSRQHALIVDNRGDHQLVVLSRNGLTAVDGQRVQGTIDLRPGQTLQFGEIQLRYASSVPDGMGAPSDVPTDEVDLNSFGQQPVRAGQPSESATAAHASVAGNGPHNDSQGFPAPLSEKLEAPKVDDEDDFGVKSWDEIAAEAQTGAHQSVQGAPSDFERIQAAQQRAAKQSKGTNPLLLVVLVAALAGTGYMVFWPKEKKVVGDDGPQGPQCTRTICYPEENQPTCAGKSDCTKQAINAYKVSDELYQKKGANITNLYDAYKHLDRAELFLEIGGVAQTPEEMKGYKQKMEKYHTELEETARDYRIKVHQYEQRRMFLDKAKSLQAWKAFYTDKYSTWYKEAIKQERNMKDRGTWPKKF